ncbi:MAG: polymorphic toxin-type HINT domain-containing protein [Planctomycetota bacterium]
MSTSKQRSTLKTRRLIAAVVLVIGFGLSARLIFGERVLKDAPLEVTTNDAKTLPVSLGAHPRDIPATTRAIESIRLGDRVFAHNPEIEGEERESWGEPNWAECYQLSLQLPLTETATIEIELLRDEAWIRSQVGYVTENSTYQLDDLASTDGESRSLRAALETALDTLESRDEEVIGLTVAMDLPEMGATGLALVNDVQKAPRVMTGAGQVVTATFKHPPANAVLDVRFDDAEDVISVTENHLFWSEDRLAFLPIGDFEVGEQVLTCYGETKRVVSKLPRPGPDTVYNLEVYGEHVYFVGEHGILAHNGYISRSIKNQNARRSDGLINHIDPRTNKMTASPRSQLHGDHVLPKNRFKQLIKAREAQIGRSLTRTELREVNKLMNGAENLRPMNGSFNSSKQDFLAATWRRVQSKLSRQVHPDYLRDLARTQRSVHTQLRALLKSFT